MRHLLSAIALSLITIPVLAQSHPPEQPTTTTTQPRRLAIAVTLADPSDLKVAEGDRLQVGDLIADRGRERQRLEAQKAQLQLTLSQIQSATITEPLPPDAVPQMVELPPANYLEQESAVELARLEWEAKLKELEFLAEVPDLDPIILEHEQAKLTELEQRYFLERGRLEKAQQDRAYREYEDAIARAQRVEDYNQTMLTYQRQWAEYEERLRNRDYQVAQTQLRLGEIENAIASLSVIRAPYPGMVRRVKWLGQSADGLLSAEITVMVDSGDRPGE